MQGIFSLLNFLYHAPIILPTLPQGNSTKIMGRSKELQVKAEDCTLRSLKTHYLTLPKVIFFIIPSGLKVSNIIYMQMELNL